MRIRSAFAILLLALTTGSSAQPTPAVISLLQAIEISGCQMERNGQMHDGKDAAEHLRAKLARSGDVSMPAEQFIDRIASNSSVSGKPYRVHCPGRPPEEGRSWLRARLAESPR